MESWSKLHTEFAFDPKVQSMSESLQRRLAMLFCYHRAEMVPGLSDKELAHGMSISLKELAATKAVFLAKRFIDDTWYLINWEKRQGASCDSAERTRRYRERHKESHGSVTVTSRDSHGSVTCDLAPARPDQTRREEIREEEIREEIRSPSAAVPHSSCEDAGAREEPPTAGKPSLNGDKIHALTPEQLNARIAEKNAIHARDLAQAEKPPKKRR